MSLRRRRATCPSRVAKCFGNPTLPTDEKNPRADKANHDDLILWLAYKEAKALLAEPDTAEK